MGSVLLPQKEKEMKWLKDLFKIKEKDCRIYVLNNEGKFVRASKEFTETVRKTEEALKKKK